MEGFVLLRTISKGLLLGAMANFISLITTHGFASAAAPASIAKISLQHHCDGFLPENDMRIPVDTTWKMRVSLPELRKKSPGLPTAPPTAGGISEAQFNGVMDRISAIYTSVVAGKGGKLKINRKWTDATVNASAMQYGSNWEINMYGGLARHPAIGEEGMALVACHEMGHHLGGAPKINSWFGDDWATNEGGSDYFATLKCLREYFSVNDNEAWLKTQTIDPLAMSSCKSQFPSRTDELLCLRNAAAGQQVALLFQDLRKEKTAPSFGVKDPAVVKTMDDNHPATQCRFDTYFAGALCQVNSSMPVSNTDYKTGTCVQGVDTIGWRPLCWFKPN
jgi:hypothetical protein